MIEQLFFSDCCTAECVVVCDDPEEGTAFFECSQCHKPCDGKDQQ